MKRSFFFVLLLVTVLCGPCLAAEADDIHVKAEVDKAFLTIGDPVTYTVTIEHAPDIRILSNIPAPSSDILEIKKVEDIQRKQKKKVYQEQYFLT